MCSFIIFTFSPTSKRSIQATQDNHAAIADNNTAILPDREKKTENLEPPPFYQVILLNDDFTPMEFVIMVLVKIFLVPEEKAVKLMLQVHNEGRAICGIYPKDIAQTKVEWVRKLAKEHHHPLVCEWEKYS